MRGVLGNPKYNVQRARKLVDKQLGVWVETFPDEFKELIGDPRLFASIMPVSMNMFAVLVICLNVVSTKPMFWICSVIKHLICLQKTEHPLLGNWRGNSAREELTWYILHISFLLG